MKIELDISEQQYMVLLESLDLYSRLMMGQTCIIGEKLSYNGIRDKEGKPEELARLIASRYFDGIDGVSSHKGIRNTCPNGQRAYEMYSHLRYESGKEAEHSVWKYEPHSLTGENIEIKFK